MTHVIVISWVIMSCVITHRKSSQGITLTSRNPRERIVYEAAQSIRERGVIDTSVRQVVIRANAPRGSLQHYFPGGKEQMVKEALWWSADFAAIEVSRALASMSHPTPGMLFEKLTAQWERELVLRHFMRGCPLVAGAADVVATDDAIRQVISDGFEHWLSAVRRALRHMGVSPSRARSVATVIVSALEGAIILSRAEQSVRPLIDVTLELKPWLNCI